MKTCVKFSLILLLAPAFVNAMEVVPANQVSGWILDGKTKESMYEAFMKPTWPVKKNSAAALTEDALAEQAIKGLMLRANGYSNPHFDAKLTSILDKMSADKIGDLTANVVTSLKQEKIDASTPWATLNQLVSDTYPANIALNGSAIADLQAKKSGAEQKAVDLEQQRKAAEAKFIAEQKAKILAPRAALNKSAVVSSVKTDALYQEIPKLSAEEAKLTAMPQKSLADKTAYAQQESVVSAQKANVAAMRSARFDATRETLKNMVALRAITAITTTPEIDTLKNDCALEQKTTRSLQALIDERHDANDLTTLLKHAQIKKMESILADLKKERAGLQEAVKKADTTVADLLVKQQEKKLTKGDATRLNNAQANSGRLSTEIKARDEAIQALDTALHPKVVELSTGLLGLGWFGL